MPKFPKMRLKEANKKINHNQFRAVKDREEYKEEADKRKEKQMQSITPAEIAEEMKISVEDRVTPYH